MLKLEMGHSSLTAKSGIVLCYFLYYIKADSDSACQNPIFAGQLMKTVLNAATRAADAQKRPDVG